MDGPPGAVEGQNQLKGQAVAAQRLDRARKGRSRVAVEAPGDVGEAGLGAGGEVEQHGQAARTGLAARDVVPRIEAVGGRRQHLAPGLGLFGGAPVQPFRRRPPAALPPDECQGGHGQPKGAERRGGGGIEEVHEHGGMLCLSPPFEKRRRDQPNASHAILKQSVRLIVEVGQLEDLVGDKKFGSFSPLRLAKDFHGN